MIRSCSSIDLQVNRKGWALTFGLWLLGFWWVLITWHGLTWANDPVPCIKKMHMFGLIWLKTNFKPFVFVMNNSRFNIVDNYYYNYNFFLLYIISSIIINVSGCDKIFLIWFARFENACRSLSIFDVCFYVGMFKVTLMFSNQFLMLGPKTVWMARRLDSKAQCSPLSPRRLCSALIWRSKFISRGFCITRTPFISIFLQKSVWYSKYFWFKCENLQLILVKSGNLRMFWHFITFNFIWDPGGSGTPEFVRETFLNRVNFYESVEILKFCQGYDHWSRLGSDKKQKRPFMV